MGNLQADLGREPPLAVLLCAPPRQIACARGSGLVSSSVPSGCRCALARSRIVGSAVSRSTNRYPTQVRIRTDMNCLLASPGPDQDSPMAMAISRAHPTPPSPDCLQEVTGFFGAGTPSTRRGVEKGGRKMLGPTRVWPLSSVTPQLQPQLDGHAWEMPEDGAIRRAHSSLRSIPRPAARPCQPLRCLSSQTNDTTSARW